MRLFIILRLLLVPVTCFSEQVNRWKELGKGFHVATYPMPIKSFAGDSKLTVVRINPKHYELRFLTVSEHKHGSLTAKEWSNKHKLLAVINAVCSS